ncbi:MAG: Gfo/Idh/MocA family oxidoreductase [Armatimonadetes bacterium]|nr:Gfo/Idh/MocA family oxidoreductase [Armatimonadota bacterium]
MAAQTKTQTTRKRDGGKPTKKVRVALIGAGGMANAVHYPSLVEFKDVEIVGLCDMVEDKLKATAEKFQISRTFASYQKMIEETAPDAVYALMPPHHVYDVAAWVLNHKLHLFVEKPLALTTYQARTLAHHTERNDCVTAVGFQRRHVPAIVAARKKLEKRGPIHTAVGIFYKDGPEALGYYGGAIDIMTSDTVHAVDLLRWFGGSEVRSVASDVRCIGKEFPNCFHALVSFANGVTGILLGNWCSGRRFFKCEMHGTSMAAFIDPDEHGVIYGDNGALEEHLDPKTMGPGTEPYHYLGFYHENRHFIDCVKTHKQPSSCFSDAVKTMELVDRIYSSSI